MPNGLAIAGGVSFPILAPNGSAAAPSYSFLADPATGLYGLGTFAGMAVSSSGAWSMTLGDYDGGNRGVAINSAGAIAWSSGSIPANPVDLRLGRLAAASLRLGGVPSATPVAQTFTIGEASRPGTDTNVGGASGTIRSGLGTGTGTASSLIFQTPTLAASGSGTQTYATRLTVATARVTTTVPFGASGGGSVSAPDIYLASAGTNYGFWANQNNTVACVANGVPAWGCTSAYFGVYVTAVIGWGGSDPGNTAVDAGWTRLGAASICQGLAPSATPVAQTFTIGEASRPGTDSNVGGASGTIRSGLGTGTGTASSLIFQTPTLAASGSGTQAYATRLTVATAGITATAPILIPDGGVGAPGLAFASRTATGLWNDTGLGMWVSVNGSTVAGFNSAVFSLRDTTVLGWASGDPTTVGQDTALARLAAASLRLGLAPSATPVNQTFTIGESSRGGTDLNVAGANGTIRSGLGTGNAAGTSLIFQVSVPLASSTVAQTYTQVLSLSALGATFDIPDQGLRINGQVSGAGAGAGTLTNAPAAGNPNFWLPINCGGTVFFFPGW